MSAMAEPQKKPRRRVKKIKGHGGGHHGGSWKVAYADFVTALMALFLVLWLVSQADMKVKQAIASYFRSPGVFDTQAGGVLAGPKKASKEPTELTSKEEEQALFGMATMLKKKFSTAPEFGKVKEQIRIEMTEQGVRIQILDNADRVSFDSGRADLTPGAIAILAEIAKAVCQLPNPLLIGGHTDRQLFPTGSSYTNWELSADRANAARRALEQGCVEPTQIKRIVGYADTELMIPEDPYATANRRISIIVMKTSGTETAGTGKEEGKTEPQISVPMLEPEEPGRVKTSSGTTPGTPSPLQSPDHSVGVPDKIPANVSRVKEPAKSAAAVPDH
jgi:chemotaxis protein MotB